MAHRGYKVAFVAPGMQECLHRAVHASIQRAGHRAMRVLRQEASQLLDEAIQEAVG